MHDDAARPRAFAPIPELATDAEISGLFRIIEQGDRLDSNSPRQHPAVESGRGTVPAVDPRPTHQAVFARFARAVAAELNR